MLCASVREASISHPRFLSSHSITCDELLSPSSSLVHLVRLGARVRFLRSEVASSCVCTLIIYVGRRCVHSRNLKRPPTSCETRATHDARALRTATRVFADRSENAQALGNLIYSLHRWSTSVAFSS